MANLFIPKKIKIGFQERQGTFTGKLAYIIYYDEKGVLRKQKSWDSWRHQSIEPIEFDNDPQDGFILNKGIQRSGEYWGTGRSVIRVYDSRNFEFEIAIDNLIGILMHSDISKRDIQEKCVYAWNGTELVLLPCNSQDYLDAIEYTAKQSKKISTKDLVKGKTYKCKKNDRELVYIGFFDWYNRKDVNYSLRYYQTYTIEKQGKKHIFYDAQETERGHSRFIVPSVSTLSYEMDADVVENYAELVDKFLGTINSHKIVDFKIVDFDTINVKNDTYPCLYKYENDIIHTIRIYSQSYRYHDTEEERQLFYVNPNGRSYENSGVKLYEQKMEFKPNGVSAVHSMYEHSTGNKSWYRSSYQYDYKDYKQELKVLLLPICEKLGYDIYNFTSLQYVIMMKELGYGQLLAVLESGAEINIYE